VLSQVRRTVVRMVMTAGTLLPVIALLDIGAKRW
jgi:hypothetical protein